MHTPPIITICMLLRVKKSTVLRKKYSMNLRAERLRRWPPLQVEPKSTHIQYNKILYAIYREGHTHSSSLHCRTPTMTAYPSPSSLISVPLHSGTTKQIRMLHGHETKGRGGNHKPIQYYASYVGSSEVFVYLFVCLRGQRTPMQKQAREARDVAQHMPGV